MKTTATSTSYPVGSVRFTSTTPEQQVARVSDKLRRMAKKALREDKRGKTEEWPT